MSIWGSPVLLGGGGAADCWWRVLFYNYAGTVLKQTEYVQNGGDCAYGSETTWTTTQGGTAVPGITEDVSGNLTLYGAVPEIDFLCTVSGGYNGGAVITITANGSTIFTATAIGGYYNLNYDNTYAEVTVGDSTVTINVTPPPSTTGNLTITVTANGNTETMSIAPAGSNTSFGYNYSHSFAL